MNKTDEYAHLEAARLAGATIYGIADDGTLHVVGDGERKPQYSCAPDRYVALVPFAAQPPKAEVPEGWELAPNFRGYANLGLGMYLLEHSGEGEDAELIIVPASEAEKAGRTVGDLQHYEGERSIPAERMAVRLRFDNVGGLDALEQQLRILREVHFPSSPAHTSDARDAARCYSIDGDSWHDCPDDAYFVGGRSVGDEFTLEESYWSRPVRFRVTKVPDGVNDDYEVERVDAAMRQEGGNG